MLKRKWNLLKLYNFSTIRVYLYLNDTNLDFLPTSFSAILIINNSGKVNSIKTIRDNYSEEVKIQLLEIFQKLQLEPALKDDKKVCSEYYFVIGCILYR
jgi:hypothetical protein